MGEDDEKVEEAEEFEGESAPNAEPEPETEEPKQEPTKPKSRKTRTARSRAARLPVKVIEIRGKSALVEYISDGARRRVYVPEAEVSGGECNEAVLSAGHPHGVPWGDLLVDVENGETLAEDLLRLNMWTNTDIEKSVRAVQRAIARAGADLTIGDLRRLAQRHETGG